MRLPSREIIEQLRRDFPAGTRVELVQMDDAQAPPIGTFGTVLGVDDTGLLLMHWDNGSGLNVVYVWGGCGEKNLLFQRRKLTIRYTRNCLLLPLIFVYIMASN